MKKVLSFVLSFFTLVVFAGGGRNVPPTPIRGGAPPPGLPIDQFLIGLFFVGIIMIGYFSYRKMQVQK